MKERELTNILGKSINADGYEFINIPDAADMSERPYDSILGFKGKMVSIEFKRLTDYKAFNPKSLREGQVRSLERSLRCGNFPMVGLFVWKSRTYNDFMWWSWVEFKKATNNLTTSIHRDTLRDMEKSSCRKKKYDLKNFYNYLELYTNL